jgi:hypothetical protein
MRRWTSGRELDSDEMEMLRLCYMQYLIDLDVLPPIGGPVNKRWDNWIGMAICAPLYGYGLYKLLGG